MTHSIVVALNSLGINLEGKPKDEVLPFVFYYGMVTYPKDVINNGHPMWPK